VPETYPEQNPKAAWRVYEGEAVIVSPADSTLHTLNAVGTVIWEAADGRTAMDAIVGRSARIGRNAQVRAGVLGDTTSIAEYSRL